MIRVSRVLEYPVKSLSAVQHTGPQKISSSGRIGKDRQWHFVFKDESTVLNGKWACANKCPQFFGIQAQFDQTRTQITLGLDSRLDFEPRHSFQPLTANLEQQEDIICEWMSRLVGREVELESDTVMGFPDDLEKPAFTVLGEASAEAIADWFSFSADEIIERLRPNILLDGIAAFEEFSFIGRQLCFEHFKVLAAQACVRCSVPGVTPGTGIVTSGFAKTFSEHMHAELLKWTPKGQLRGSHGYFAALNCAPLPDIGADATVAVDERVQLR